MKVIFDIVHPADVLFFYQPINILKNLGHDVLVTSRRKDVVAELLMDFNIEHISVSDAGSGVIGLACELIKRDVALLNIAKRESPDVMIGFGGVAISHVGTLLKIPSISFYDTETAPLQHAMTLPFISKMYVPECYTGRIAEGRTSYFPGQKDFSYFHPENFKADTKLAIKAGYKESSDNYFIRLVAWNANHDIGKQGWDDKTLNNLVSLLSQRGTVHISSERSLPDNLNIHLYRGETSHIHHLLAHCKAYIGESATMAGEAVLLGVPAICAANIKLGYTDKLEEHSLLWNIRDVNINAIERCLGEIDKITSKDWDHKFENFMKGKVNLANYIVDSILEYNRR